jgi:hypothetical protein
MEGDSSSSIEENPYETLIMDLKAGNDIESNYSYERDRLDGLGKERIYCIDNIPRTISEKKLKEQQLETKRKLLVENEIVEQNKLVHEHKKKIRDEEEKLEKKDNEINELVKVEVSAKQKKLDDMKIGKDNFE